MATLEKADDTALRASGWRPPEVFTAKGRNGQTDIWGLIYRPSNFSPNTKYPVLEHIYSGPHDSFVPKRFTPANAMQAMAELGFLVVRIDGMRTSNRSKAFHDICWKNLADAGFPDRVLWHKAAAAQHPTCNLSRVGIYGHSAGGQNSLGALLFHGDFYHAAVSSAGCHDNRMDKISWSEQWMGWPALIKAKKQFDLLVLPGANHGGAPTTASGSARLGRRAVSYFTPLVPLGGGAPVNEPPFLPRFLNRLLGVNSCRSEEANPKYIPLFPDRIPPADHFCPGV